ncbi:PspC domain-containing protein [Altererythrobacter sp. MF3-039]|uniref:PspC domain-containing protein n=1 Tax=Altererythrobacter sp. MF3-039 TaxID=3252901 RepID=UPI00390CA242
MSKIDVRPVGTSPSRSFRLDRQNDKIWGVCSGIANYTGIDATWVRIGFVVSAFISVGTTALVYAAIALIAD